MTATPCTTAPDGVTLAPAARGTWARASAAPVVGGVSAPAQGPTVRGSSVTRKSLTVPPVTGASVAFGRGLPPAPYRSTAPHLPPAPDTAAPPRFPRRGVPSAPVRPTAPHKTPVPTSAHSSPRAARVQRSPR
ncbi:hypothetical protein GCM10010345_24240 [Streptomyces canarius]|uniref:Uncharacterized protein n=1 Tax=Streptomyces canarius TaxID=285453 RepID=A0ABQ3CIK1_9ACTN|nr:hypothetical protein GCM10010345_24240 [Streptomyces canarius]